MKRKIVVNQPDGSVEEHEMGVAVEDPPEVVEEVKEEAFEDPDEVVIPEDVDEEATEDAEDADEADEESEGGSTDSSEEPEEDDVVVQIGEEKAEEAEDVSKAPEWVRDLRKKNRDLAKRNRELEELARGKAPVSSVPTVGKKPTLEDHGYDPDKFEAAFEKWQEDKRKVAEYQQTKESEAEEQQRAWNQRLEVYGQSKKDLRARDFADAEDFVKETLSTVQQGIILQGATNSALVVYAIGKNPKRAQALAAIKDPVKFAFAIASMEKDLKVTSRPKAPPAPPRTPVSRAPITGSKSEAQLDRLRSKAEKTGDYTEIVAYKRRMKETRG